MSCNPTAYFPDTGQPCPPLLTVDETVRLLRLDTINIDDREGVLFRYRQSGILRGTQVSKKIFYRLEEVLAFLERQTEAVQR